MTQISKIILSIPLLIILCSCAGGNGLFNKPISLNTNPPKGPYDYQKGWKDGCESGIASTNTFFQTTLGTHKFTLDQSLRNDRLYNQAWRYGFNHCGYSMRALAKYDF